MNGRKDVCMNGNMDGTMDVRVHGRMDFCMYGRVEGRMKKIFLFLDIIFGWIIGLWKGG